MGMLNQKYFSCLCVILTGKHFVLVDKGLEAVNVLFIMYVCRYQ